MREVPVVKILPSKWLRRQRLMYVDILERNFLSILTQKYKLKGKLVSKELPSLYIGIIQYKKKDEQEIFSAIEQIENKAILCGYDFLDITQVQMRIAE